MSQLIISNALKQFNNPSSLISPDPATYPIPISSQSAAVTLQNAISQNDHETIMGVAQKLIETMWKRDNKRRYVANLLEEWTGELFELHCHVKGRKPVSMAPPGFELNRINKALYFFIPIQDGYSQQVHWVQQLPDGQVAALLKEYTLNQKPFMGDLYVKAIINKDKEPPMLFPV